VAQRENYLRSTEKGNEFGVNKKAVTYLNEAWIHPTYAVSVGTMVRHNVTNNYSAGQLDNCAC
jgi:hypothetical protein